MNKSAQQHPPDRARAENRARHGRKTLLNAALRKQICKLLERGHTIKTVADSGGFSERSFFDWCEKNAAFLAATQRARAVGRVRIVESILKHPDWRAKAWYLERTDPAQFGRSADRPARVPAEPDNSIGVAILLQAPDGTKREVSFEEAQKITGADKFPVVNQADDVIHHDGQDDDSENGAEPESHFELRRKGLL